MINIYQVQQNQFNERYTSHFTEICKQVGKEDNKSWIFPIKDIQFNGNDDFDMLSMLIHGGIYKGNIIEAKLANYTHLMIIKE